jgi:predicted secreted protein
MFTKITLTLITLIMLVTMSGCGTTSPSNSDASANSSTNKTPQTYTETNSANNYQMLPMISGKVANVMLDAMADGTTQELKKGEVMGVTLESNPSTGFGWFATIANQEILAQMGDAQYTAPPTSSSTPILGAAGTETIFFQAIATGITTLTLDYKQGFDKTTAPAKTIIIIVEVK